MILYWKRYQSRYRGDKLHPILFAKSGYSSSPNPLYTVYNRVLFQIQKHTEYCFNLISVNMYCAVINSRKRLYTNLVITPFRQTFLVVRYNIIELCSFFVFLLCLSIQKSRTRFELGVCFFETSNWTVYIWTILFDTCCFISNETINYKHALNKRKICFFNSLFCYFTNRKNSVTKV